MARFGSKDSWLRGLRFRVCGLKVEGLWVQDLRLEVLGSLGFRVGGAWFGVEFFWGFYFDLLLAHIPGNPTKGRSALKFETVDQKIHAARRWRL